MLNLKKRTGALRGRGTYHTRRLAGIVVLVVACTHDHLHESVVRPAVQNSTNVADPRSASGGTFQCMQFLPFFIYFSYLPYLGHLSLIGLQIKTRRQRNSSTFCPFKSYNLETFMSSAATAFVHDTGKRSQKVPRAKTGTFWFPRMDSQDSKTFNSSCTTLQYKTGMKVFCRAVPELHGIKKLENFSTTAWYSPCLLEVLSRLILSSKCQGGERSI